MTGHPDLPNFDPDYCARVVRIAAAASVVLALITIAILLTVDPSHGQCPGWRFPTKNSGAVSLWFVVTFFTAPAVIWICVIAVRWAWFTQKILDAVTRSERRAAASSWYVAITGLDRATICRFPFNAVWLVAITGWALLSNAALGTILTTCTKWASP